ncbi:hypothetical protein KY290_038274 [Solanum tuberosum]|uniref:Uncharacterized protein n=1 Tax=Solanum tuberosum TaxID=4113 RepID=A0ABQ7TXZ8_SOLTU|nr:hypothetical protein KY290_038274 [Solanum tuberosum]
MEEHELANSAGSNIVKTKVRGPIRCTKIINLQEGEKLDVEFDKDFQAIDEKTPSRVDAFMESRKRKKGKQVDAFQQDVIDQFDQFKKTARKRRNFFK